MLAGAEILADDTARAADGKGAPAEAGDAKLGREDGRGDETWRSIGVLAAELMEKIRDRATHQAPCEMARAPGGVVAKATRRRNAR